MKCNNCGREISDTSNFCVYCGTQVANQQYAQNAAAMGNMAEAKASDKKGKIGLIVLVVIIFAVISGIICNFAFNLVKKYVMPELARITDINTDTNTIKKIMPKIVINTCAPNTPFTTFSAFSNCSPCACILPFSNS